MGDTYTQTGLDRTSTLNISPVATLVKLSGPSTLHGGGLTPDEERSDVTHERVDPFNFRNAIKTDAQLEELRNRKQGKPVAEYHREQNERIGQLLKPLEEHTADAAEAKVDARLPVKIAVYGSFFANLCSCILQIYATVGSGSYAILASGIEAVFDIGGNVIMGWFHRKSKRLDINEWPVGGSRLETIGNISYGFLMAAVNLVVVVECVRDMLTSRELKHFHLIPVISVAVALGAKFTMFCYCFALRNMDSQVRMLWQDHRNDVLVSSFAILTAAGGSKLAWWLDPVGGMILALGVIFSWLGTLSSQFQFLGGKSASHEFLQLVTYKAATFSDEIEQIDTVRAYHSGPGYFVEVDIVMAADTPLWRAHDLSEQMQDKLETLPGVERAFVHVDHETTHKPEHRNCQ